jgi:hypothetical protein
MSQPISRITHGSPAQQTRPPASTAREVMHGVFVGLVPLLLLAILVAATIALTTIVRQSTFHDGFFVWERNALIALTTGMVLALLVYIVSLVLVMQAVARWLKSGLLARSTSTLWALVITAIVVLLPVIIGVLLPQTPAP